MKSYFTTILSSLPKVKSPILFVMLLSMFMICGCTANRFDSRRNWHRIPASTGHSKCGCARRRVHKNIIENKYPIYVLQA